MKTTLTFLFVILLAAGLTSSRAENIRMDSNLGTEDSTCAVPTNLTTTDITATSATVKWDKVEGAFGYKVRYKVTGTSQWTKKKITTGGKRQLNNLDPNTNYTWQVKTFCSVNPGVSSAWSSNQKFTTSAQKLEASSNGISFDVYPNPVNSSSVISFSLAGDSRVQIQLVDVTGRTIQSVIDENLSSGNHKVILNRDQLSAGIYFLQLKMNDREVMTKKVVVE